MGRRSIETAHPLRLHERKGLRKSLLLLACDHTYALEQVPETTIFAVEARPHHDRQLCSHVKLVDVAKGEPLFEFFLVCFLQ